MKNKPLIGIIIGSDSDYPVIENGIKILDDFNIPYEVTISSAHRTPEETHKYAKSASHRGLKIIIAAAGGAAHLPGVIAANSDLPVIGVPIRSKNLQGLDSLLSIVEMPKGVPVATVGIDNIENAVLLAIRILAINSKDLIKKLQLFRNKMVKDIEKKNSSLQAKLNQER